MKYLIKIVTTLVIIGSLVISVGGCAKEVTAEELMTNMQTATDDLESYAQNLDMAMTLSGVLEGEQTDLTMTIYTEGVVQPKDEKMQLDTSFTISVEADSGSMDQTVNMTMYVVEGTAYIGVYGTDNEVSWSTQPMQMNVWDQQAQLEQQVKLVENSDITSMTTETIDGITCYALDLNPAIDDLWDQFSQFFDQLGLSSDNLDLEDVIKNLTAEIWVTADSWYVKKAHVYEELEVSAALLGQDSSDYLNVTAEMTTNFSDFNQTVDIEVPDMGE